MTEEEEGGRRYVKATWKSGTHGRPKQSGGEEVNAKGKPITARGFNRPDQRYSKPVSEIRAARLARATELEKVALFLDNGENYQITTPEGNRYLIALDFSKCNCGDFFRLQESYPNEPGLICKHIGAIQCHANTAANWPLAWTCAKMAAAMTVSVNTVRAHCEQRHIVAVKKLATWAIDAVHAPDYVTQYLARIPAGGSSILEQTE